MSLLNKLFKNKKEKPIVKPEKEKKIAEKMATVPEKPAPKAKTAEFKPGKILLSPVTTEKAVSGQKSNQYIFKILSGANKIMVADAIRKTYKVKVVAVNIINIPKKEIRVGRTKGFKAGYKKAIITLAKGQSIELK